MQVSWLPLAAALLLAGCTPAGMMAAVIVVGTEKGLDDPRTPEMAADRKIAEQDCSKPIDTSLGNVRCK